MTTRKKSQRWAAGFLTVLCMAGLSACTAPITSADAAPTDRPEAREVTLYEREGLTIALPNAYLDQLLIVTEPEQASEDGTHLLSVYEKHSYEDSGGCAGFLFSLVRYTQAQYERFLSSDGSGQRFFARDDSHYYGYFTATDVQFYREGESIDTESDGWKAWEALGEMGHTVADDFTIRNGLTAYSDRAFFDRDFTYDGEHRYITYDGEYDGWTLVLSQPCTQGDEGIWCVERRHDNNYGNLYYVFPEGDQASGEVYAALQAVCDSGKKPELLDPMQVATAYLTEYFGAPPTPGSVRPVEGVPAGNVLGLCNEVFDQFGALQAATLTESGSSVKDEALGVPDYYDQPFRSHAASRLYPLLWLKAEKPDVLSGNVVYCYNEEHTKTLTFCQQDSLLCVATDGTERWFKPAYAYKETPYDRMLGFYTGFYEAAHPAPQHSYSDAEIQSAIDVVTALFETEMDGCTLNGTTYDAKLSYTAAESYLHSGKGSVNGAAIENVLVLYTSFTTDGQQTVLEPNRTYEDYMFILLRADAGSDWVVDDRGY